MKKGKLSIAYPNYDQYIHFDSARDTAKWIDSVKNMYYRVHQGADRLAAFNAITSGWDNMEKLAFTNWLKYYEEGAHNKYASNTDSLPVVTAQVGYWEDINRAGYFVPVHQDPTADTNNVDPAPIDFTNPEANAQIVESDKREIIEAQRAKILSRLDSAEKLLRSPDGHTMAGTELSNLMRAIYDLKERIHVVNKKFASQKLYADIVAREANVLVRRGFTNASRLLIKIADGDDLTATPPTDPTAIGGLPGNIPGEAPGQVPPPNDAPTTEPISEGMKGFLEGLDTGNFTPGADELEVHDADDELDVMDEMVVEAQAVPAKPPANPSPPPPASKANEPKADIEVDDTAPQERGVDADVMIERALSGVTIQTVINKLEDLAKIFKNREVPRQLAVVDLMLDKLNLASFFPTLAEAMNRSLDSNQYMSSRIEDILSRLRGTIPTREIDLKNDKAIDSPEVAGLKQKLETEDEKEKIRKENRKKQQEAEEAKVTPEIEVEEDLGQPATMTGAVPPAPKPLPPPVK